MSEINKKVKNGPGDHHLTWNRVTDLHREVPIDVSQPQAQLPGLSNYSLEAFDASSDEEDGISYIQECLSEVFEGIPRLHRRRDGRSFLSLNTPKETEASGASYFGIPVNKDTGFTNANSLAKFISSCPKKDSSQNASHGSLQSPKDKCKPRLPSEQENVEPQPRIINKNRILEPRDWHKDLDLRTFLKNRVKNDFQNSARLSCKQVSNKDSRKLRNLSVNVQYNVFKSKREICFVEGESADKSTDSDSHEVHISEEVCQEIPENESLKNEASGPDIFPEIQTSRKLLDILGTSESNANKEEDANNNSWSKQTPEYGSLLEKSDLEVAYETIRDVDLSVTFQNMSMHEEDIVGLNSSNYIILDETVGSVEEVSIVESTPILQKKEEPNTQFPNTQELEEIHIPSASAEKDLKSDELSTVEQELEPVTKNHQEERRSSSEKPEPQAVSKEFLKNIANEEAVSSSNETEEGTQRENLKLKSEEGNKRENLKLKSEAETKAQEAEKTVLLSNEAGNEGLEPEPVKAYMLPFISDNPEENRDNEDPRWSYMAKLQTDEERYQLCRKLWKSLVVPDPNVNLTYFGYLRHKRSQAVPGNKPGNSSTQGPPSRKRQREQDENHSEPPKKRARGIVNLNFTQRSIDRRKDSVTRDYYRDLHAGRYYYNRARLEKAYFEKMEQLRLAQAEIIARHNFYLGLPDQTASISQADVEQELQEMEQHYEKYKHIYRWTERALFV
nr:uncharacterized protein DDB_G0284459-like [Penaeus vannamei]